MEFNDTYELAAQAASARRASDIAAKAAIEQAFSRMEEIVPPALTLIESKPADSNE